MLTVFRPAALTLCAAALAGCNGVPPMVVDYLTVSEAVQRCEQVQANMDLPIGCTMGYIESEFTITVSFYDSEDMAEYWDSMLTAIALPFCIATMERGQDARVVVALVEENVWRMFFCPTGGMTDWFSLDEDSI